MTSDAQDRIAALEQSLAPLELSNFPAASFIRRGKLRWADNSLGTGVHARNVYHLMR